MLKLGVIKMKRRFLCPLLHRSMQESFVFVKSLSLVAFRFPFDNLWLFFAKAPNDSQLALPSFFIALKLLRSDDTELVTMALASASATQKFLGDIAKKWVEHPFLAVTANANLFANVQCELTLAIFSWLYLYSLYLKGSLTLNSQ